MKSKMLSAFGAVILLSEAVFAALVEVTDSYRVSVSASGDGVTASTPKFTGWPEDIPQPIFWFDCNITNGWEIFRGEDGANYVTKIPSLVGDGRFLTTDTTLEGTTFTGWGPNRNKPKPPRLVEFADLPGGPALDFGGNNSKMGMMFNPHNYASAVGGTQSLLANIGSVVALWGSQNGGGYLFGGGNFSASSKENYRWVRGWDNVLGSDSATVRYWCALLGNHADTISHNPGFFMYDTFPASGELAGLNGGWSVIGLSADAAKWYAAGIGLGDTRTDYDYGRNGGCRIGEMMIFDQVLTKDQMRRAQIFLRSKWLDKGVRGVNGDAHLGQLRVMPKNVTAEVNVPEGETLTVQKLAGGRNGCAVEKTGEGVLKLENAGSFTAPIKINAGSLQLQRRNAPESVADLPGGLYLHFDPSNQSSLTVEQSGGTNFVSRIDDLAGGKYKNKSVFLAPLADAGGRDLRPYLADTSLQTGLPLLDFGEMNGSGGGRYLKFYADGGSDSAKSFNPYVAGTMVAVVCAERGGGHIANNQFARSSESPKKWGHSTGLMSSVSVGNAAIANNNSASRIFVDGQRLSATAGYPHPGHHVIAYHVQPRSISSIGATTVSDQTYAGGLMLGEILIWNRPLEDEELKEVSAYLSKKWLGRDLPGYSGTETSLADVQHLKTEDSAEVEVLAGNEVKVGKLESTGVLNKTGEGTLLVGGESDLSQANLKVRAGRIAVADLRAEVADDVYEPAEGAALHLDASDAGSVVTVERNGTNFVERWRSPNGLGVYQSSESRQPWLVNDKAELLNGKNVVDFGTYAKESGDSTATGGRWLKFDVPFDSVRSVFIVRGSQAGGGMLLGEDEDGIKSDWTRYGSMEATLKQPIIGTPSSAVSNGEFYLDGVRTNCTTALPTGGYELIDLHPAAGTHVSALALYQRWYMHGGQRIAELIIYERRLSEREKAATRNYLIRKWFPERELQPLPEAAEAEACKVLSIGTVEDEVSEFEVASPLAARILDGTGDLEKTGGSTLSVADISGFKGKLSVVEGELAITGERPVADPVLVEEGRILHLDTTWGMSTVTNADKSVSLTGWNSRLDDGWSAVPGVSYNSSIVKYPSVLENGLKGLPIVKMTYHPGGEGEEYLVFHKDGVKTRLEGIKSVFWVIGSQEGGGFLMGGGGSSGYGWHRDGNGGSSAADGYVAHHAFDSVEKAAWRLNGVDVKKSDGLSGGYDLLSMVMSPASDSPANADGLAFDGRIFIPQDYRSRSGRQRIGELIVYDRILSAEERLKVEAYLAVKWFNAQAAGTNTAEIVLASGTTLTAGSEQYVDALSGAGSVDCDIIVRRFAVDCGENDILTVNGKLTVAPGAVITLENFTSPPPSRLLPVAAAEVVEGRENLASAEIAGVPDKFKARAVVRNGMLCIDFGVGTTIIVR